VFHKLTFVCSLVFLVAGSLGDLVVPVTLKYAIDVWTLKRQSLRLSAVLFFVS
jgi:hypothetical protein